MECTAPGTQLVALSRLIESRSGATRSRGRLTTTSAPQWNCFAFGFVPPVNDRKKRVRCWFCRSILGRLPRDRTEEHIVPQWLEEFLGLRDFKIEPTLTSLPDGKRLAQRTHTVAGFLAGRICSTCNNGWMSDLETRAKTVLLSLLQGSREIGDLSDFESLAVARWVAKTAYCLNIGGHENRIPTSHFEALRQVTSGLPAGVVVLASTHEPTRPFSFEAGGTWRHDALSSRPGIALLQTTSYKTTLQFGRLIFNVVFWPLRGWILKLEQGLSTPVWPRQLRFIQYQIEIPLPTESDAWCQRLNLGIAAARDALQDPPAGR